MLVVDDAHLLDSASAALVHHLVARRGHRVIATVRSGSPAPDAVRALWKDALLPRLDLGPLSVEETGEILGTALGGRVESSAVARLHEAGQGNALYLRELVLSGALAEFGGVWRWRGPSAMTATLRETVAGRIGDVTPAEREVLEFLAYGEPLGAGLLAGLASPDAVERLEDRQLVTVEQDGRRLQVRLAHPLYGELIRAGCGLLRARRVMRGLAEAVDRTGARRREDVLRVAVWRLDGGAPGDARSMLAACERARMVRDLILAERLGRAAVAAGGGAPALIMLGRVLFHADEHREAEEVAAAAWPMDLDDAERTELSALRAFNLCYGLGRVELASAFLEEAAARVRSEDGRQGLRCIAVSLMNFAGDLSGARAGMAEIRRMPVSGARAARSAATVEMGILAAEGRARECLALVEEVGAGDAENQATPSMTAALLEAATHATLLLGDLPAAERHCDAGYRLDGRFGSWGRVLVEFGARKAQLLRLRGQVGDALGWAREAVARLPGSGMFAGLCLGELAHAQALLGEVAAAERTLARAEELAMPISPHVVVPLRLAKVWTLAARGDTRGAVELALDVAGDTLPGYLPFALYDVVRLGRPELVADRLAALPIEGALVAAFTRHARARTGARLDDASAELERLGLTLYAAEAAARAALAYREAGLARGARASEARAWHLTSRCQGARTAALMGLEAPDLTPRQREVAVLAVQGLTNRDIAKRLHVSIRTVANTLYAVYTRTGVNDRAALGELLEGPAPGEVRGPARGR
ncbi:LuxR family transcriptional regulator [Sphaerisporangium sp. TRM90804]|uniref:LuxR C-terminal-related transcriptional regulator n=1 Tax=Sphaerisporangium sp. TRM90804 TaxID=3031113 RepID=UPI00244C4B2B|nr:LuxR family transcriptional regulator [Sphaerisporangium sp. TRM90804]MDH2430501.1 LuxR C-terminal-related transcriptional regulator [Sphaerisporangium sp. TRM90804]